MRPKGYAPPGNVALCSGQVYWAWITSICMPQPHRVDLAPDSYVELCDNHSRPRATPPRRCNPKSPSWRGFPGNEVRMSFSCSYRQSLLVVITLLLLPAFAAAAPAGSPQDVLTYHGDNLRTGWLAAETQLTVSNVNASTFGLLNTVVLDGRVDAEPLYVSQQTILNKGVRNVVYVATENNSVYAIDADTAIILWRKNFGHAVPYQYKSFDTNEFPGMAILSTPVIHRL